MVYCERNALDKRLRKLQRENLICLVHYPVEKSSRTKHIRTLAIPSAVRWEESHARWENSTHTRDSVTGSEHFEKIVELIGPQNRCDALHVDSAFKTKCVCFVTEDSDILNVREQLFKLTRLRIFSSKEECLYTFLSSLSKNI